MELQSRRLLDVAGPTFWRELVVMLALNLLITVLLYLLGANYDFLPTLKTCNAIGFSSVGMR